MEEKRYKALKFSEMIKNKTKEEKDAIRERYKTYSDSDLNEEERKFRDEDVVVTRQQREPEKITIEEGEKKYGFNPVRTVKNWFIEPKEEFVARKKREEQIKNKAKEAYYRGREAYETKKAYQKGRSGGQGGITGFLTNFAANATTVKSVKRTQGGYTFQDPFATNIFQGPAPTSRGKRKKQGKKRQRVRRTQEGFNSLNLNTGLSRIW